MTATTRDKMEFAYLMGRYTDMSLPIVKRLMRLVATHVRIETELANGYKMHTQGCKCRMRSEGCVWDHERTERAKRKRDRIDARIEAMCAEYKLRVVYGALTVSLVGAPDMTEEWLGREVYVP